MERRSSLMCIHDTKRSSSRHVAVLLQRTCFPFTQLSYFKTLVHLCSISSLNPSCDNSLSTTCCACWPPVSLFSLEETKGPSSSKVYRILAVLSTPQLFLEHLLRLCLCWCILCVCTTVGKLRYVRPMENLSSTVERGLSWTECACPHPNSYIEALTPSVAPLEMGPPKK